MATRIDTVASREKLKLRREPYGQRVRKSCVVVYRKMTASGHSAWLARARDEDNGAKQLFKPLGEFAEFADHLRFDAAAKAALTWFDHLGRGGAARTSTVSDACARDVRHLRATKPERAVKDTEARLKNCVLSNAKLAATELTKLTPAHLDSWRKALRDLATRSGGRRGARRSDNTLNRDMTCFRAALNLKIGQDKSGKDRRIKLPDVTATFFEAAAKEKLPTAPLLLRADGKAWNKDAWKWPIKAAVETAKPPDGTTAYTLRHSVISDLVHDGLDLLTVAQISGTSVAMIERHHGHLRGEIAATALARLAL